MITEQQRQERRLGIGGSDMPIILGLSKYKTPYQLYLEKIGEIESNSEETQCQYWGNQLEPLIVSEFEKRNKVTVQQRETIVHPFHPFLRGNLDGFIPELNSVLEVKCSNQFMAKEWGEDGSDIIPMTYLAQVAHYCSITNADFAYIAVLIGGHDYREFKYIRNMELETMVVNEAKKFWEYVQVRTPPPAMNQIDLRLMFPQHEPEKTVPITPEIEKEIEELANVKIQIKQVNDLEDKYKFTIMQFMKDAECLTDATGRPLISWKANKRGSRTFLMKGF